MIRANTGRFVPIVAAVAMLLAMAAAAMATPLRLPSPRPLIALPDLPSETEEPEVMDEDGEDDACIMACRSAALLPVIVDYTASCEKSALGQELFQLVRAHGEGYMDFAEDLGSWCFWLVLDIFIEDGLDSQIVAAFERIRSPSY